MQYWAAVRWRCEMEIYLEITQPISDDLGEVYTGLKARKFIFQKCPFCRCAGCGSLFLLSRAKM